MSVPNESFREVANILFGAGADELVSKLSPKEKRERTEARIGLASNVVGIGAGVAGLKDAGGHFREISRVKNGEVHTPKPFKVSGKTKALAGGAVALQAANLVGDGVANRVLARSAKKKDDVKKRLVPVAKNSPGGSDMHVPGTAKTVERKFIQDKVDRHTKRGKLVMLAGDKVKEKLGKSEDFTISKINEDKRQVFGWASIVKKDGEHVVDLQGDYIDIDEIEKSAYDYVMKSRQGGDMHQRDGEKPKVVGTMIESFLVTPEKIEKMGLPETTPLGWWVGYQVEDDEVWNLVKSKKRLGFSIHGRGMRTPDVI